MSTNQRHVNAHQFRFLEIDLKQANWPRVGAVPSGRLIGTLSSNDPCGELSAVWSSGRSWPGRVAGGRNRRSVGSRLAATLFQTSPTDRSLVVQLTVRAGNAVVRPLKARDARLHERSMPLGIDIEIVQERHHAINWITGYGDLPWDEVTTDT